MKGVQLRIFVTELQKHDGLLLYDWLLRKAKEMGVRGGGVFREIAGYGRHDRLHKNFFFELSGDLPVEVMFTMTDSEAAQFMKLLESEKLALFYIKSAAEYGVIGES